MDVESFDAIIIGAGPAGAFAAFKLSSIGLKVKLLESSKEIRRKVCGEYLCPSAVDLLANENLLEPLLSEFYPIEGMNIYSPNGNEVLSYFPKQNEKHLGRALNRKVFEERLNSLAKSSGASVSFDQRVSSINFLGDTWHIKTQNKSYQGNLLIGADGRNSFTAKSLGLKKSLNTNRVALHCYLKAENKNSRNGEMHIFSNGNYIGIDPINDYETNFSLVCHKNELKEIREPRDLLNKYIDSSKILKSNYSSISNDVKIHSVTPITNHMRRFTGKRFALIGDAAGFIDPLTGEGMYNGLWMAKTLADEIAHHKNLQEAINSYSKKRKTFFRQKRILNNLFQFIIKSPLICEFIARFLQKKQERANIFVGIIGNIYRPLEGLVKLIKA